MLIVHNLQNSTKRSELSLQAVTKAHPGQMIPHCAFFLTIFFLSLGINTALIHQPNGGAYLFLSPWMLIKDNKPHGSFLCCFKLAVTSAPLTLTHTWPDGGENSFNTLPLALPEATGACKPNVSVPPELTSTTERNASLG